MTDIAPIIVRGLPPIWGAPSPSPFVIKLLTWLRMAGIAHQLKPLDLPPRSTTGKIPYIELPSGEVLADSSRIIARLSKERGVDLDAGLDGRSRATAQLVHSTLEGHLYFAAGLYERFASPEGWAHTRRDYFRNLPMPMRAVAPLLARRNALRNLHGQGTGRLPRDEVAAIARADLRALSATLGESAYVLGDRPHTVDATALGFLWAISSHPFESASRAALESHANLVEYVARMRARCWADFAG
jgi:glutathione S-transferase